MRSAPGRIAAGVAAACVAAPLAAAALSVVLDLADGAGLEHENLRLLSTTLGYSMYLVPIALIISLSVGVPWALRLERKSRPRFRELVLLGALLGAAPFLLFDLYVVAVDFVVSARHDFAPFYWTIRQTVRRQVESLAVAAGWLATGAWCGAWSAAAYWGIVYRDRRDKPDSAR